MTTIMKAVLIIFFLSIIAITDLLAKNGCAIVKSTLKKTCSKMKISAGHGWSKAECIKFTEKDGHYFDRIGVKMCTEHFNYFKGENNRIEIDYKKKKSKRKPQFKDRELLKEMKKCLSYIANKSFSTKDYQSCALANTRGLTSKSITDKQRELVLSRCIMTVGKTLESIKKQLIQKCKSCAKDRFLNIEKIKEYLVRKKSCHNSKDDQYNLFGRVASTRKKFVEMFLYPTKELEIKKRLAVFMPTFGRYKPRGCRGDMGRFLSNIGAPKSQGVSRYSSMYNVGGYPHYLSQKPPTNYQWGELRRRKSAVKIDSKGVLHYTKLRGGRGLSKKQLTLKPGMMIHAVDSVASRKKGNKWQGGHWMMYLGVINGVAYTIDGIGGKIHPFNTSAVGGVLAITVDKIVDPYHGHEK